MRISGTEQSSVILSKAMQSDLINNMDHMRISGIESSSVIHSQTK